MKKYYDTKGRQETLKNNLHGAKKLTEKLKNTKNEINNYHSSSIGNLRETVKNYKKSVKELINDFHAGITNRTAKTIQNIKNNYGVYELSFNETLQKNDEMYHESSNSILLKMRTMNEVNLAHQIGLLELFVEYCDAKLYHNFLPCVYLQAPLLTDELLKINEKLITMEWDALKQSNPTSE